MPNPPAIHHGSVYHIYNRGINRENIFVEERNYQYFLALLEKYIGPIAEIYAFCLLRNHFHLLVRILSAEILKSSGILSSPSQHFSNFFNAYAKAINKAYDRTGSLFQRPFGRVLIENDAQLLQTVLYIHYNPFKHGFVDDFRDWPLSSYEALLSNEESFLTRDAVLDYFGGRGEFVRFHEDQTPKVLKTFGVYPGNPLRPVLHTQIHAQEAGGRPVCLFAGVWLFPRQVLREEAYLKQQYGQAYADYCARVGRYL